MRGRLLRLVDEIRASFWFIPTLMMTAAVVLSVLTVGVDQRVDPADLPGGQFLYRNEPEGARSLLSTIASSMINVAGVVFSLTIVALTLASQQFGPRLLGNFMRDRGNQLALGTFVSTFLYCLLILRTVRGGGEGQDAFVPHVSVTVALLITLITLGTLIYFIHHVAASIQVQNVVSKIARALRPHVAPGEERKLFPSGVGTPLEATAAHRMPTGEGRRIVSQGAGYLHTIDARALLEVAARHDAVVELHVRPGTFVMHGARLMDVFPHDLEGECVNEMTATLSLGAGRAESEDVEALFDQLLELALRALSPASNDPFTANACLDRISDALLELGRGEWPSLYRGDEHGNLRLVVPAFGLDELATRLFASLRTSLASSLAAASYAESRLFEIADATENAELARAAQHQRGELLETCRERMSVEDYHALRVGGA